MIKTRTLKAVTGVSALLMVCGMASAAARPVSAAKTQPVTITFDAMEYSAAALKFFPRFAREFEASHPNIKVNVRVISWSSGEQVLNTEIGAGHAPNVAIIGTRWLPGYVNDGLIQPLTSYMTPSFTREFYPAALDSVKYKGTVYALPEAMSVRLLVYNKNLFKKAGITSPPKTWTQLAADAIKIHKTTGQSGYALVGSQVETSLDYWYAMWGFGGKIFSGTSGSAAASPADVKALQFLVNLIHNGGTEPSVTASTRSGLEPVFAAGKIGMMIDGPWLVADALAAKLPVGVASVPSQPGVPAKNVAITDSFVMFKNSSKAQEKAAWEFTKFMFTKPVRTYFDKAEGMLPTMKIVGEEPFFRTSSEFAPYLKALNGPTRFEPVVPGFQAVSLAYTNAVEAAYSGSLTPKVALQQAAPKITAALK